MAEFLDRTLKLAVEIQASVGKPLKDFLAAIPKSEKVRMMAFDKKTPDLALT